MQIQLMQNMSKIQIVFLWYIFYKTVTVRIQHGFRLLRAAN